MMTDCRHQIMWLTNQRRFPEISGKYAFALLFPRKNTGNVWAPNFMRKTNKKIKFEVQKFHSSRKKFTHLSPSGRFILFEKSRARSKHVYAYVSRAQYASIPYLRRSNVERNSILVWHIFRPICFEFMNSRRYFRSVFTFRCINTSYRQLYMCDHETQITIDN